MGAAARLRMRLRITGACRDTPRWCYGRSRTETREAVMGALDRVVSQRRYAVRAEVEADLGVHFRVWVPERNLVKDQFPTLPLPETQALIPDPTDPVVFDRLVVVNLGQDFHYAPA